MTRVPATLALLALRQSGYHLSPSTLRSWVHRGRVTRTAKGYSLQEIEQYLACRDEDQRVSA
jgi:DNA-binding transcriptional MerR regulator